MAGKRGGARPGAGRKPKSQKYESPIAAAEKQITDRLPLLIERAFELADGVEVEKAMPNGETKFYSQPPCIKAITYLVDRILGKPTERKEISGPEGTPIKAYVGFNPDDV